jgi:hypothetical protein
MNEKMYLIMCTLLGVFTLAAGVRAKPSAVQGSFARFIIKTKENDFLYTATLKNGGMQLLQMWKLGGAAWLQNSGDIMDAKRSGNFWVIMRREQGQIFTAGGEKLYSYGYSPNQLETWLLNRTITAQTREEKTFARRKERV